MIRIVLIMLLSILLTACSPDYNWREVKVGGGAVTAFFPDKPVTQSRQLNFAGHEVSFALTSATVGDALFTVAYAPLPDAIRDSAEARGQFATAVMHSLYRNLGAAEPAVLPAFGEPFVIEGKSPQGPMRLKATIWLTSHALVEGLVMAEEAEFPGDQADEFLQGLKLAQ